MKAEREKEGRKPGRSENTGGEFEVCTSLPTRHVGTGGPVNEKGNETAESGEDPSAGRSQLNTHSFRRHNDAYLYNIRENLAFNMVDTQPLKFKLSIARSIYERRTRRKRQHVLAYSQHLWIDSGGGITHVVSVVQPIQRCWRVRVRGAAARPGVTTAAIYIAVSSTRAAQR